MKGSIRICPATSRPILIMPLGLLLRKMIVKMTAPFIPSTNTLFTCKTTAGLNPPNMFLLFSANKRRFYPSANPYKIEIALRVLCAQHYPQWWVQFCAQDYSQFCVQFCAQYCAQFCVYSPLPLSREEREKREKRNEKKKRGRGKSRFLAKPSLSLFFCLKIIWIVKS